MKRFLIILQVLACLTASAQQAVPNFQLSDVVSGETVSLEQLAGKPVVVIFASNDCPYDNYYSTRFATLVGQYGDRVVFLFINSHLDPQESEESMKRKASGWGFKARYLSDKSQVAMETLGARRSPEVFLLKPGNGQFSVFYSGAIDDNPQEAAAVTSPYLRDALENLLSGKPAVAPVRAAGCSIRRK